MDAIEKFANRLYWKHYGHPKFFPSWVNETEFKTYFFKLVRNLVINSNKHGFNELFEAQIQGLQFPFSSPYAYIKEFDFDMNEYLFPSYLVSFLKGKTKIKHFKKRLETLGYVPDIDALKQMTSLQLNCGDEELICVHDFLVPLKKSVSR